MSSFYATREAIKAAGKISGTSADAHIDGLLESMSRDIDGLTHRHFIPKTELHNFRWPQPDNPKSNVLYVDTDLLSVSLLTKDDDTATVIAASDFFLEPQNEGPPFYKIELDNASTAFFSFLFTTQRAVRVTGDWGFSDNTLDAGTVTSGLASSAAATTFLASDGSLIEIGHTLLIESERIFVSGRTDSDLGVNTSGTGLAKDKSTETLTLGGAPTVALKVGEVVRIANERMRIDAITSTTVFTVTRGWDGTTLAAHGDAQDVFVERDFTIERGVNGTSAATHANAKAITKYDPDSRVQAWLVAKVLRNRQQDVAGWGQTVGSGEGTVELRGTSFQKFEQRLINQLRRRTIGVA